MYWKINIVVILLMISCRSEDRSVATSQLVETSDPHSNYLIEVSELKEIIGQENVKVIDFRKSELYDQKHISGALNIWRSDIEDRTYPYEGMMADPAQIETLFSELGISNQDILVIYDNNGLCDAARLWWILQNYDFNNVKLLHGGLEEWIEGEGATSDVKPILVKTAFQLTDTPSMKYYISKDELSEALSDDLIIIDARSAEEYSGLEQKRGAAKSGRIPNSFHLDWENSVDINNNKRFKTKQELSAIYHQGAARAGKPIVVYCHSGVRSAHTTFVLTQLLGFERVRNYDGSWVEWSHFDNLNFEKDSTAIIN